MRTSLDTYKICLNQNKVPFFYSWPSIIIVLLFGTFNLLFFIGLFMLWKRTRLDKLSNFYMWKVLLVLGVLVCFGAAVLLMTGAGMIQGLALLTPAAVDSVTIWLVIGIAVILLAFWLALRSKKTSRYIDAIYNKKLLTISKIASYVGGSAEIVRGDLLRLIARDICRGIY